MSGFGGGAASASNPFHPHALRRQQQQQQQQQQQPAVTTTQQHALPRQEKGKPGRQRYKSCDFCTERKKKCDRKLPRCSLCVQKNQAHCHYQLKPPTKSRGGGKPGADVVDIESTKRLAGQAPASYGGSVPAVPDTRVAAIEPGSISLKRCRLGASPATGMVGMQENDFLADFFRCLGMLPLATESIVRGAMVEVMMEAVAPPNRQQQQQLLSLADHEDEHDNPQHSGGRGGSEGTNSVVGERQGFGSGWGFGFGGIESEDGKRETGWSEGLGVRATSANPRRCMMWCAIALGALVRGAPIDHASRYASLARQALATCFDGNGIEDVRAYAMMSFLYSLIRDERKHQQYLAFAKGIASNLRPGEVPKELDVMLLQIEKRKLFNDTEGDDVGAYCTTLVGLPPVGDILHQKDLCRLFLVADRRMHQAFMADMMSQGALDADVGNDQDGRGEPVNGGFLDQEEGDGDGLASGRGARAGVEQVEDTGLPAGNGPKSCGDRFDRREQPCAGPAVQGYVQEVLPEMSRLSKALVSSDSTAGIGGVYYHGNVAYMQAMKGDMASCFESLRACADVVQRYPGIVRIKPHMVHCILAMSHSRDRGMYDAIRAVYNDIGHVGCRPAPPFEEWGGIDQLCKHIFCRSMHGKIQRNANLLVEPTDHGQKNGSPAWRLHSSASGPVPVGPVVTEPTLTEVLTMAANPPKEAARQDSTTLFEGSAAPDEYGYNLTDPQTPDKLALPPVPPAAAAISVGRGGDVDRGVAARAGAPSPQLASASMERESGAILEGMDITDADLLEISAMLMSEEGSLDELL
eukprot:g4313.t1